MTIDEMRRLFDELTQPARQSSQWKVEQEEAFAAERAWIKKAFLSAPMDADGERYRNPQFTSRYTGRPVRERRLVCEMENGSKIYGWVEEQIPEKKTREVSELQAGDTAELDSFLAGFSTK